MCAHKSKQEGSKHTHIKRHLSVCTSEHLMCTGFLVTGSTQLLLSIQHSKALNVCNTTQDLPTHISWIAYMFKLDIYHKLLDHSLRDADILPICYFTLKYPQEFGIPHQLRWAQVALPPWHIPLFWMILMYVWAFSGVSEIHQPPF